MTIKTDPMMERSKDSSYMLPYWDRVDAVIDGIEAVRAASTTYLPKFTKEPQPQYDYRLQCTKMTNVYRDIIEGLASKPFEQEVTLLTNEEAEAPASITAFVNDVDGSSNNMHVFAGDLFFNGIVGAISWIFVDYSKPVEGVVSRADAQQMGRRAFWSHVLARNVLDVRSEVIGGRETLTYFKMYEPGEPDHIREFTRDNNGLIAWALYKWFPEIDPQAEGQVANSHYRKIDDGILSIGVIPMVPFITGRRNGRTWRIHPPMKDAVDLQLELYLQESGLKYAKTMTAYPMLAANGISPKRGADGNPETLMVGPSTVLYSQADASTGKVGSWSYVEPSAESLKFLADDIDRTIRELRELGRQPLTAQAGNITVITAAVAANKARSAVKQWALILKDALENALMMTLLYEGNTSYKPNVHVFIEFDDFLESEDITALGDANARGKISDITYREELKRRGVLSSNFTEEREEARLLKQLPGDSDVPEERMNNA